MKAKGMECGLPYDYVSCVALPRGVGYTIEADSQILKVDLRKSRTTRGIAWISMEYMVIVI